LKYLIYSPEYVAYNLTDSVSLVYISNTINCAELKVSAKNHWVYGSNYSILSFTSN